MPLSRVRAVPWLVFFQAARAVRSHLLTALTPAERARVAEILRSSGGRPQRVSPAEREELRQLARKLDLGTLAREIGPLALRARGRRSRRW